MTYQEFCERTGAAISYAFYKDIIEPMYMTPDTDFIDKNRFCRMFQRRALEMIDAEYFAYNDKEEKYEH